MWATGTQFSYYYYYYSFILLYTFLFFLSLHFFLFLCCVSAMCCPCRWWCLHKVAQSSADVGDIFGLRLEQNGWDNSSIQEIIKTESLLQQHTAEECCVVVYLEQFFPFLADTERFMHAWFFYLSRCLSCAVHVTQFFLFLFVISARVYILYIIYIYLYLVFV